MYYPIGFIQDILYEIHLSKKKVNLLNIINYAIKCYKFNKAFYKKIMNFSNEEMCKYKNLTWGSTVGWKDRIDKEGRK